LPGLILQPRTSGCNIQPLGDFIYFFLVENDIRPFVVGRKNWLFAGSPDGARASATFFTLIQTAKANGLEPYAYLRYIFKKLPLVQTEQDLKDLLPQNINSEAIAVMDQR